MSRESPIYRSLYRPVLWMGVERMVAIIFILSLGCLIAMAAMYAKAWAETVMLIAAASIGFALLRRRNLKDGMYFRLLWHRRNFEDSYPAFNLSRAFTRNIKSNERSKSRSTEGRDREFELEQASKRLKRGGE